MKAFKTIIVAKLCIRPGVIHILEAYLQQRERLKRETAYFLPACAPHPDIEWRHQPPRGQTEKEKRHPLFRAQVAPHLRGADVGRRLKPLRPLQDDGPFRHQNHHDLPIRNHRPPPRSNRQASVGGFHFGWLSSIPDEVY